MLLREYLRQEGYYFAPPERVNHPSTSDVTEQDVTRLSPEWIPDAVRFDPTMIDGLINVFDDFAGEMPIPEGINDRYFRVKQLEQQSMPKVEHEQDVRILISGSFLTALFFINSHLDSPMIIQEEGEAVRNANSRVDIVLGGQPERRAFLELKNPTIVDLVIQLLQRSFKVELMAGAKTPGRKAVNKLALYMASHHIRWGALSSHNKWIFFRLFKGMKGNNAYLTFSSVVSLHAVVGEDCSSRTKPLRAFLGMLVATARDINVTSGENLQEQLDPIPEGEYEDPDDNSSGDTERDSSQDGSDGSCRPPGEGLSHGSTGAYGYGASRRLFGVRPVSHRQRLRIPDILISWSLDVTPANRWLKFYVANDAKQLGSSFGPKPVRFRLQRLIGAGTTGYVYEAKAVDDGGEIGLEGYRYALKMVRKGTTGGERDRIARLLNELRIYTAIEEARLGGRLINAVPRCHGLYETKFTMALVLDYAGESLPELGWQQLKGHEREDIFEVVKEIHELGITHEDFDLRNVVRASDGTLKIIDFTASKLHRCRGIGKANGLQRDPKRGKGCAELLWIQRELMLPLRDSAVN